jgi:hypothetical protein
MVAAGMLPKSRLLKRRRTACVLGLGANACHCASRAQRPVRSRLAPDWFSASRRNFTMQRFRRVLGTLVCLFAGVGLLWYYGPVLIRDFGIGTDVDVAARARLVKGRCESWRGVNFCHLAIDQAGRQTELNYFFLDSRTSDYQVSLQSPKSDKSIVTTDIGQKMLWNRAITLGAVSLFFLSIGIALPLTNNKTVLSWFKITAA